jgi:hypothetical protein
MGGTFYLPYAEEKRFQGIADKSMVTVITYSGKGEKCAS